MSCAKAEGFGEQLTAWHLLNAAEVKAGALCHAESSVLAHPSNQNPGLDMKLLIHVYSNRKINFK